MNQAVFNDLVWHCVVCTAVKVNGRHDATGLRFLRPEARTGQDNDGWASAAELYSAMVWTRQFSSVADHAGLHAPVMPGAPAGATMRGLGLHTRSKQSRGGPGPSALIDSARGAVRQVLQFVCSIHIGSNSHA